MDKISFGEMHLSDNISRAVESMGFEYATPIQSQAIPAIRTGVDVIAKSQTGTGKTVAFGIPALEKINIQESSVQVLILCPTRELAMQGYEEIGKLARFEHGIRPVAIYGGTPITRQCISLRTANIVIGTPGRVMDHIRRKSLKLNGLKMLVLDEADEMLNMGFREDIETILLSAPDERQTILFSATMPPAIMKITKQFQQSPTLIEIDKGQVTINNINQLYIDVPHSSKKDSLALLLQYYEPTRTIIFTGTKKMADELAEFLHEKSMTADSIHSDIKQSQRTATMQAFKSGKIRALIATDIAARGIDVSDIDYVINYDVPDNTEYYVHRIGRTGRAGKSGTSITICSSGREVSQMKQIALQAKSDILPLELPTAKKVQAKGVEKAAIQLELKLQDESAPVYQTLFTHLIEKGFSADDIATAALSILYQDLSKHAVTVPQMKHKPDTYQDKFTAYDKNDRTERNTKRKSESKGRLLDVDFGMVVFSLGYNSKVTPNHLLGAILDRTGLEKRDIGRIDIHEDETYIEISKENMNAVLEEMGNCRINGKEVLITPLVGEKKKTSRSSGRKKGDYPRHKPSSKSNFHRRK